MAVSSATQLDIAREFASNLPRHSRVILSCHGDADGLSAAVLASHALQALNDCDVILDPAGKGEHVHSDSVRERLQKARADALLVLDMGSRGEPIVPGLPTLLIDHHQPRGFPPEAVIVSAAGDPDPIAPTSLLVYRLFRPLCELEPHAWLALVGTLGDLGSQADFPEVDELLRIYRRKHITETVALVNAAKRSSAHDVHLAAAVLRRARNPAEIAQGKVLGSERLQEYRAEVAAEVSRCARAAPKFSGNVALVQVSSGAQVHPLLAIRWANRLKGFIVLVANENYLPGRVNFSVRTTSDADLTAFLRDLPLEEVTGDIGHGHAKATGGSLPLTEFDQLLRVLGFRSGS